MKVIINEHGKSFFKDNPEHIDVFFFPSRFELLILSLWNMYLNHWATLFVFLLLFNGKLEFLFLHQWWKFFWVIPEGSPKDHVSKVSSIFIQPVGWPSRAGTNTHTHAWTNTSRQAGRHARTHARMQAGRQAGRQAGNLPQWPIYSNQHAQFIFTKYSFSKDKFLGGVSNLHGLSRLGKFLHYDEANGMVCCHLCNCLQDQES